MNIVITGASRGIGYQTALQFSTDPSNKVYALSRSMDGLTRLVKESGGRVIPFECDITNSGSVKNFIDEIKRTSTSVEVLINNAGRLVKKNLDVITMEDWRAVYEVNVFGVFNMVKELLPLLRNGKLNTEMGIHSHVVNISSMGGVQGSMKFAGLSAYSSSKGALITFTECLSEELKGEGVRVNCVALGSVDTEMFAEAFPGLKAGGEVREISGWIRQFSEEGWRFFNGKTLPLSATTP